MTDDRSLINYGIDQRRMALLIAVANLPEDGWAALVSWGFECGDRARADDVVPATAAALREVAAAAAVYMQDQN